MTTERIKLTLHGYLITKYPLPYFEIAQYNLSSNDIHIHYRYDKNAFNPNQLLQCVFKVQPATTSLEERIRKRKEKQKEQQFIIQLQD